jgi:glycosyltransferase involved in cell wall biosynthesis
MTAAATRPIASDADRGRQARRRIVILTEDSKPALGGIAEYLHQLALSTTTTHDVLVVTSVPGARALNPVIPFEYRETRWFRAQEPRLGDEFAVLRRLNTLMWRLDRPSQVRRLLAAIDAEEPNSSYVLGRLSPVTFPWCRACHSLGIPYSAIGYGLELVEPLSKRLARERVGFVAGADHWFAISRDTGAKLSQLGVPFDRQSLLLPGVATPSDIPPTPAQRRSMRERLGIGDHRFVFSLSYLRRRKGIDLGIEAFAAVAGEFASLRYVVGGSGPEQESLAELARARGVGDRVLFVGAIDDAAKAALFAECEFFLLPNRAEAHDVEGFGIVFLEAGLYGKAVIGGNNGGVPEAVVDGVTGLLVDTRDAANVTVALRTLLLDPGRAATMGQRGSERARRDFDWADRGSAFTGELDAVSRMSPLDRDARRSRPVSRLRRYAGTTSNRVVSTAYVFGELSRVGRLTTYVTRRDVPADVAACKHHTLSWLQLAFAAGGDGGGAAAGYHVANGWAGAYPEITGYLIPTLLLAAREARAPDSVDALRGTAARAGDWLARTRLAGGAICRKQWFAGNTSPSVFNTGQVIDGWCALALAPGLSPQPKHDWLQLACESGDWLISEQEPDGSWVRNAFNGIPHSYYARVAAPLARLGQVTRQPRYLAAARAAADWVISRQTVSGWFANAGFAPGEAPTTHTIGYVIEGLARCGTLLEDARFEEAADRAARALLDVYTRRGYLPGRFAADWQPRSRWRCLTGDAQVAISWALLASQTGDARYHRAAESVADAIRQTVRLVPEWPEISGAVQGSSPAWGEYDPFAYPTHAAKFTLDLFALLDP